MEIVKQKTMKTNYLESIRKQFAYYKLLGDNTFKQLSEDELFWSSGLESNSIGTIVKHLRGNMLSRWTDFLSSDGEKLWRNREDEFEMDLRDKEHLISLWEEGWKCLFKAIDSINETNFGTIVYIRNSGHSVLEAFNRQLGHYSYHVGQIVFIGKMLKATEWESLSIAKGNSDSYNQEKFNQPKRKAHFTDEFLDEKEQ